MNSKHPLNGQPYVQIVRHANGVAVGNAHDLRRDVSTPEAVHVFTSFNELAEFLKGWWPDAGKE